MPWCYLEIIDGCLVIRVEELGQLQLLAVVKEHVPCGRWRIYGRGRKRWWEIDGRRQLIWSLGILDFRTGQLTDLVSIWVF
jgi:hypothetical protein